MSDLLNIEHDGRIAQLESEVMNLYILLKGTVDAIAFLGEKLKEDDNNIKVLKEEVDALKALI